MFLFSQFVCTRTQEERGFDTLKVRLEFTMTTKKLFCALSSLQMISQQFFLRKALELLKMTISGVKKAGGLKEKKKGNVEELLQQETKLESSPVPGPHPPQHLQSLINLFGVR